MILRNLYYQNFNITLTRERDSVLLIKILSLPRIINISFVFSDFFLIFAWKQYFYYKKENFKVSYHPYNNSNVSDTES